MKKFILVAVLFSGIFALLLSSASFQNSSTKIAETAPPSPLAVFLRA